MAKTIITKFTEQETLLFEAIKEGNIEAIKTLSKNGVNLNIFGEQYGVYRSISPLEFAIYCNSSADLIICMLDLGAKVDEVNDDRRRTILEIVLVFYKDNTIVDYLLSKGAQFASEAHRYAFEGNIKGLQDIEGDISKIKTASG